MNRVILMGRLGQDPELRTTGGGTSVCDLNLATEDSFKGKDGSWSKKTEWHKVTVWGKTADNACKYLNKGSGVLVEGRIETQKWQDKQGNDRYTTKVVADKVEFLPKNISDSGGGRREESRGGGSSGGGSSGGGGREEPGSDFNPDDDLPF